MARSKRAAQASLFRRSADEWRAVLPYGTTADALAAAPQLGFPWLRRYGLLTDAETAMIRAVAEGSATHELLTRDYATRLLSELAAFRETTQDDDHPDHPQH